MQDFIQKKVEDCEHENIGRELIEHDGISHSSGEQFCFDCKKTVKQILVEAYTKGREEAN